MVTQVLNLIFGSKNDREIKTLRPIVEQINGLEAGLTPLSDQALADNTQDFRKRLEAGQLLDDIFPKRLPCAEKCLAANSTCGISMCNSSVEYSPPWPHRRNENR